jgi:hypothetical protein
MQPFESLCEQSIFTAQVLPLLAPTSSIIWIGSTLSDRCDNGHVQLPSLASSRTRVPRSMSDCAVSQGGCQQFQLLGV